MNPVSHLHFHSEYSLQDSIIRIDKTDEWVKKYGVKNIALTDHGTVDGAIKFYQAVKKAGANPLLGCEMYVVDDRNDRTDKKRYHSVLIAKNRNGFNKIMRALTIANTEGFYIRPRIDWQYILDNIEDCVYLTACEAGVHSHPQAAELIGKLMEKFGDDFYWEAILLKNYPPQRRVNETIRDLRSVCGGKIVFTNDVHYLEKDDWRAREVVRRLSYGLKMQPYESETPGNPDLYLKTYEQMVECAIDQGFDNPEAVMEEVWDEIVEKCTWNLEPMEVTVPLAYPEAKDDPAGFLRDFCYSVIEADEKLRSDPKVKERTDYELKEIIELGFAEYFLLVTDMVQWAKNNGCMVGPGRGSAGGSLVAFILNITDVNPLDYDLVFERFISPGRHDLPDIDLDFEDVNREKVIAYMRQKYGEQSVALVSTFSSSKGRGTVRDVSRVYSVPLVEVDQIAKQILVRSGGDARSDFTIEDTVTLFENAKEFAQKYPYVIATCKVVEGAIKTKGVHAAGLVVDSTDLYNGEKCVIVRTKGGELAVNWDKKDLEFMGMMKIDALGLKTLNILCIAKEEINRRHSVVADYSILPLDDPKVLEAFTKADTAGIFQFGSAGMIQYIRNFKPKNFNELVQVNSLFRPGTLRSGMASKFILYKDGVEKPVYVNAQMKELLGETHGIVLYQEQMMRILNKLSGIPWRTVDVIRKVVSKSEGQDKFETFRKDWLVGVQKLGTMSVADAQKVFTLMKFFGSYGFNKSHSVEYTMLGYWTMWLKMYYPTEFFHATLVRASDDDIVPLLTDAQRHNIKIKSPDINCSGYSWTIEDTGVLRGGFDIIKGISTNFALELVKAREAHGGKFEDIFDFAANIPRRLIIIGKIKALLCSKAMDSIISEEDRKKLILYLDIKKKFPTSEKQYESIDVAAYVDTDVLAYEMPEEYLTQNKALVDILSRHFCVKKLSYLSGRENEAIPEHSYHIGKYDEIKFGFRQKVEQAHGTGSDVDVKGYASDLGGCYGIFRDDTSLTYSTVTGKLYHSELKGEIEEIASRMIIMRANKPAKTSNIFMDRFQFMDYIKKGDLGMLDYRGIVPFVGLSHETISPTFDISNELAKCDLCPMRASCKAPVPISSGEFGALVIGEAPGAEEDASGIPFIGRSGKALWDILSQSNITRDQLYVSNVLKCRPPSNKIDDPEVAMTCAGRWLQREIKAIHPPLILSLGKTALHFLSGDKKSSIMEKNGTVEWSERWGAWLCFSVHPAMVLYSASNLALLELGVNRFIDLFGKMI